MANVFPTNMTTNTAPSPYVAASSTDFDATFKPFMCFDSGVSFGQYWVASTNTGWVSIDLGSTASYSVNNYTVRVNSVPEPNRAPKDWTFQGSNDNSAWTTIDTVTGQTAWGSGESRVFTPAANTVGYRYFRINVSANNGDALLQLGELQMDGSVVVAGTTIAWITA